MTDVVILKLQKDVSSLDEHIRAHLDLIHGAKTSNHIVSNTDSGENLDAMVRLLAEVRIGLQHVKKSTDATSDLRTLSPFLNVLSLTRVVACTSWNALQNILSVSNPPRSSPHTGKTAFPVQEEKEPLASSAAGGEMDCAQFVAMQRFHLRRILAELFFVGASLESVLESDCLPHAGAFSFTASTKCSQVLDEKACYESGHMCLRVVRDAIHIEPQSNNLISLWMKRAEVLLHIITKFGHGLEQSILTPSGASAYVQHVSVVPVGDGDTAASLLSFRLQKLCTDICTTKVQWWNCCSPEERPSLSTRLLCLTSLLKLFGVAWNNAEVTVKLCRLVGSAFEEWEHETAAKTEQGSDVHRCAKVVLPLTGSTLADLLCTALNTAIDVAATHVWPSSPVHTATASIALDVLLLQSLYAQLVFALHYVGRLTDCLHVFESPAFARVSELVSSLLPTMSGTAAHDAALLTSLTHLVHFQCVSAVLLSDKQHSDEARKDHCTAALASLMRVLHSGTLSLGHLISVSGEVRRWVHRLTRGGPETRVMVSGVVDRLKHLYEQATCSPLSTGEEHAIFLGDVLVDTQLLLLLGDDQQHQDASAAAIHADEAGCEVLMHTATLIDVQCKAISALKVLTLYTSEFLAQRLARYGEALRVLAWRVYQHHCVAPPASEGSALQPGGASYRAAVTAAAMLEIVAGRLLPVCDADESAEAMQLLARCRLHAAQCSKNEPSCSTQWLALAANAAEGALAYKRNSVPGVLLVLDVRTAMGDDKGVEAALSDLMHCDPIEDVLDALHFIAHKMVLEAASQPTLTTTCRRVPRRLLHVALKNYTELLIASNQKVDRVFSAAFHASPAAVLLKGYVMSLLQMLSEQQCAKTGDDAESTAVEHLLETAHCIEQVFQLIASFECSPPLAVVDASAATANSCAAALALTEHVTWWVNALMYVAQELLDTAVCASCKSQRDVEKAAVLELLEMVDRIVSRCLRWTESQEDSFTATALHMWDSLCIDLMSLALTARLEHLSIACSSRQLVDNVIPRIQSLATESAVLEERNVHCSNRKRRRVHDEGAPSATVTTENALGHATDELISIANFLVAAWSDLFCEGSFSADPPHQSSGAVVQSVASALAKVMSVCGCNPDLLETLAISAGVNPHVSSRYIPDMDNSPLQKIRAKRIFWCVECARLEAHLRQLFVVSCEGSQPAFPKTLSVLTRALGALAHCVDLAQCRLEQLHSCFLFLAAVGLIRDAKVASSCDDDEEGDRGRGMWIKEDWVTIDDDLIFTCASEAIATAQGIRTADSPQLQKIIDSLLGTADTTSELSDSAERHLEQVCVDCWNHACYFFNVKTSRSSSSLHNSRSSQFALWRTMTTTFVSFLPRDSVTRVAIERQLSRRSETADVVE